MSMYTRCASCGTHFKVTVQQLQACSGQVRCGRCATVFDAFATLTARLPGRPEEPPPLEHGERGAPWPSPELADAPVPRPSPSPRQSATPTPMATAPAALTARQSAVFSVAGGADALPRNLSGYPALAGGAERPIPLSLSAPMAGTGPNEPPSLSLPDNLFGQSYGKVLPGASWMWSSGIALLAALALLQMLYFFRTELAANFPSLRTPLVALCKPFSCEVQLPRYPDSLFIESSDLQVVNTKKSNEVLLTALIRNRADRLQAYPALELTLTNTMDHPIGKRVFQPREYLAEPSVELAGFAPGAEVNVRLMLNTGDLRASGYRLFLFFPN